MPMKNDKRAGRRCLASIVGGMAILELMLIFLSWILSSVFTGLGIRTLISSEGIRWMLGNFTDNLSGSLLVWLILAGMAWGTVRRSGVDKTVCKLFASAGTTYRERLAFAIMAAELLLVVIVMLLLTCMPQATLLSATGNLFPSSFSRSIVAVVCFVVIVLSATFGLVTGSVKSLADMAECLVAGCRSVSSLIVLYVFANQLYFSVAYVFFL